MVSSQTEMKLGARLHPGHSTALKSNVKYRLGKLREHGLLKGTWLDCGCAEGGYTFAMLQMGVDRVVGVDVEVDRVREARAINEFGPSIANFSCALAEDMPFRSASFDGVFLNEVLEHVMNEELTLREIYRVLRPGGHLVLMSPNRWFPFEGHGMDILGKTVNMPVPFLPWLPRQIGARFMRARNYWPRELHHLVRNAGFEIQSSGSVFPVFELYPWIPAFIIPWYRRTVPWLEKAPILRKFGLSTFILAIRSGE
jgi:SAM-dependent methyltransferase